MFLPSLALVLVTGTIADRVNRKAIVFAASGIEIGASLAFAALAAGGLVRLETALPIIVGIGIARAFGSTAERTLLINVVAPDQYMRVSARFGILRSSVAVGAFLAAVVLHFRPPSRRVGATLLVTVAGFGLATLVFAFSRSIWLAGIALATLGAFDMVSVVIRNGLVQLNTPDAMRGRVSAIEMVFIGASNELGSFESGVLAQLLGAVGAVAAGGIATLAIVVLWAYAFPALRRSDRLTTTP